MKKRKSRNIDRQAKSDSLPSKPANDMTRRQFAALATSLSAGALLSGNAEATQAKQASAAPPKPAAAEPNHLVAGQVLSPAPEFIPDWIFKASSLTDWHTLGNATWKAESGVITGTPANGGGWLILNKSFQDVQFFMRMKCAGNCNAGVLLRAEKTETGMKGIYVALKEGDLEAHRVTLDPSGNELTHIESAQF